MNVEQQAYAALDQAEYGQAEALFDTLPEDSRAFGLGYVYAFTGRFEEARAIYTALRTKNVGLPLEHVCLHQLGMVERMAGEWNAALECFQEEAELIATLGDSPLPVSANAYELGTVWQALGEAQKAREYFEQAVQAQQASGDLVALGCGERGLGDWYAAQDERSKATAHWQAALEAFSEAGDAKAVQDVKEQLAPSR
ncbi:tetratricopeptide repeat protein [Deinococcus rubellus]|uniref:Tetratricopeptide repeat protein n=1 Tax=Deinococcus rubellus TaxID=1889240 RepID=A0ABY5YF49_9DEIO|nr:tetratricopeptide repeat protein [Deinococcus rubellus]UWX63663.1 tetratricopeptide repeat protein [Deinococcus rubellus]